MAAGRPARLTASVLAPVAQAEEKPFEPMDLDDGSGLDLKHQDENEPSTSSLLSATANSDLVDRYVEGMPMDRDPPPDLGDQLPDVDAMPVAVPAVADAPAPAVAGVAPVSAIADMDAAFVLPPIVHDATANRDIRSPPFVDPLGQQLSRPVGALFVGESKTGKKFPAFKTTGTGRGFSMGRNAILTCTLSSLSFRKQNYVPIQKFPEYPLNYAVNQLRRLPCLLTVFAWKRGQHEEVHGDIVSYLDIDSLLLVSA